MEGRRKGLYGMVAVREGYVGCVGLHGVEKRNMGWVGCEPRGVEDEGGVVGLVKKGES